MINLLGNTCDIGAQGILKNYQLIKTKITIVLS